MTASALRKIPSVDKLAQALGNTDFPYAVVIEAIRRHVASLRKHGKIPEFEEILSRLRSALRIVSASRLQPVINGTGILVHTNFGRAPLGRRVMESVSRIALQYNNLEYGLAEGSRGGRAVYLENNLALLCGAEAATVVNNNAAALVLILRHFCKNETPPSSRGRRGKSLRTPTHKNQVVISRGELVQIGGGFRIPEILESSGARLREVGATNKTSLSDYARAITRETALILKVHRSNFFMEGFVDYPSAEAIAKLARQKRVPFVEDLGSGAMIKTDAIAGMQHEPTPAESLRNGIDLVCFSGDKLFGGPQAGIIAGNAKLVAALKREPLFRALRCDKLILAALEATVDIYLRNASGHSDPKSNANTPAHHDIPLLAMLHVSNDELRSRAQNIIAAIEGVRLRIVIGQGRAQIGGGALPRSILPSITLDISHRTLKPQELAAQLRSRTPPIVGYIEKGRFKVDLRTVFADQDSEVIAALRAIE